MIMETKNCLACDKPVKGRTDKKFCDDLCRNKYNNQLKATTNNVVRNINNALSKNRRILEELILPSEEMAKISKEKLLERGFQFKYVTHIYRNKKEITYFFCYDYGYLLLGSEWCLVVRAW